MAAARQQWTQSSCLAPEGSQLLDICARAVIVSIIHITPEALQQVRLSAKESFLEKLKFQMARADENSGNFVLIASIPTS